MGDDLNFDICPLGQGGDLDGGAGREVRREITGIDFIHAGEIRKVRQEDSALDYVSKAKVLIFENDLDVFEDALRLGFDVPGDEVSAGRFDWDLAGAEQQVADSNGLIVRPDCRGALG